MKQHPNTHLHAEIRRLKKHLRWTDIIFSLFFLLTWTFIVLVYFLTKG